MDIPLVRTITRVIENERASSQSQVSQTSSDTGAPNNILSKDDFLKLLLTQLHYQDPVNSLSIQDFTGQLVQFSTLDSVLQQQEAVDKMADKMMRLEAVSLLGKKVKVGDTIGIVSKVTFETDGPKIWINDQSYNLSLVSEVDYNG
ncbi:MAG: flagellar hook assembly protein FlgD [bacterium]